MRVQIGGRMVGGADAQIALGARQMRTRVDVARADDERPGRGLSAQHAVESGRSRVLADIRRGAEARFKGQSRPADHHVGAVLEERARQGEEVVVADQRIAQESDVALIALARDAKRRPIPSDAEAEQSSRRSERTFGVRVEHDRMIGIWIGGAERVRLLGLLAPDARGVEAQSAGRFTERVKPHVSGHHVLCRVAGALIEFDRD